jgi:hypothetical protein
MHCLLGSKILRKSMIARAGQSPGMTALGLTGKFGGMADAAALRSNVSLVFGADRPDDEQ